MTPCDSLTGVDPATLQLWLSQAQTALRDLAMGQRAVTIVTTGAGQHREVTYERNSNSMAQLRAWIAELQRALGKGRPRSALSVSF